MGELLETIVACIEGDISFQPDLKQEVAKTLLSLLKIRKQQDYIMSSVIILGRLEEKMDRRAKMRQGLGEKNLGFASIHESKIAASAFPDLSESEADEIKAYLEGSVSRREKTLEQYMSRELGLETKESYNPDDYRGEGPKLAATMLSMFNSGNLEDFTLKPPKRIGSNRIREIATQFYANSGYKVEEDCGCLKASNETEALLITISNFVESIMVSVIRMR